VVLLFETEVKLKKWGSSIGVVLPKKEIKKENLKAGQTVSIRLAKKANPLKKTFGTLKFHKPTQQLFEEADKELWNE